MPIGGVCHRIEETATSSGHVLGCSAVWLIVLLPDMAVSYVCKIETGSEVLDQCTFSYAQENQITVIVLLMHLWAFTNIKVKHQAKCYTLDL